MIKMAATREGQHGLVTEILKEVQVFRLVLLLTLTITCGLQVEANQNTGRRSRDHIEMMLQLNKPEKLNGLTEKRVLDELTTIYKQHIKPMEENYKFTSLQRHSISEGEMYAKPLVLFLGPWSSGKTTMINYLLGVEGTKQLHTGAEPTTRDFTVVTHGEKYKTVEGMALLTDINKPYTPLKKFGMSFADRLRGIELPSKLLEKVTIIDTPGVIENKKQQERGYPFNQVCQWFIDRAALIFLVFDPTKLDVGTELDKLFQQLKGKESQIRLILNKADTVHTQELMRVYGALFWSLAPIVNLVEPPRVYVGSFWQKSYRENTAAELFFAEELSLLNDLNELIKNHIETKLSYIRQHAILVRIHALLVDKYLAAYEANTGMFTDVNAVQKKIVGEPENYAIYTSILADKDISSQDLPAPEVYQEFFAIHPIHSFVPVACSGWRTCKISELEKAINFDLPQLLMKYQNLQAKKTCDNNNNCEEKTKKAENRGSSSKPTDKPQKMSQDEKSKYQEKNNT